MTKKEVEVISDIRCDVCEESCQTEGAVSNIEFGTLSAHWGHGTQHDGEELLSNVVYGVRRRSFLTLPASVFRP